MLPAPLALEYVRIFKEADHLTKLLETGDRVRRTRGHPSGTRVRRTPDAPGRD